MELRHYFRMLLAGWWIIALTVCAALAIALALSYIATPIYRANTRLIVRPNVPSLGNSSVIESLNTLDKRSIVSTYAEVLGSVRIFTEAATPLQLAPLALAKYTRTSVVLPDSNILEVAVTGPDPVVAARLANAIGQRGIEYVKGLYQAYALDTLDSAAVPTSPISPQPVRDAGLAVALGVILGAALAILREQLRMPLEALRRRNVLDPSSSAYSRRYFLRYLEEELQRKRGGVLALGLLQLDGLEGLSETLPAGVFHSILHHVTHTLQAELRGRDIVGRWGEISFALLLPATPGTAAMRTLDRVLQVLSIPVSLNETEGEKVRLQPHIGIVATNGNEEIAAVLDRAQKSLERTLQSGHSPIHFSENGH